ncbi:HD domain-containing phosphohydrolase [Humibacter soli]
MGAAAERAGAGEQPARPPRRVEVLASLSVAIDLGLGQPAEHMLRSCVIACRLADRLCLTEEQRACVYYSTLVMWIGCHADSPEYARWFGDDIAVRRDAYLVDWTGLPYLRFLLGNIARGESPGTRMRTVAELLRDAKGQLGILIHSHCTSAAALARHIGLGDDVAHAVEFTFERWDGAGLPSGASGEAIPIEMRVAQLADVAEVHQRTYGLDGAVAMARSRRGGQFDPAVVDVLLADPQEILEPSPGDDTWADALALAPDDELPLTGPALDELISAVGDFVDLKCPFMLGHSRAVAALASAAAVRAGLGDDGAAVLRRAGHLHDIGRLGVSNQIWSKQGDLSAAEWERVRMHPYLTDRVLIRVPALDPVRLVARAHHERLDGSGYPLGATGATLSRGSRLLAASVAYQDGLEPRPYRQELSSDQAANRLRDGVARGHLDGECVEAVLAAALAAEGTASPRIHRDDDLTPREAEVLGLVARGLNTREIALRLVLSEKTVRNHLERSYAKIGASNRVGASLYALDHGLVEPE